MNTSSSSSRPGAHGFTLIEILTVITIIAILMALLMTAMNPATQAARRAEARNAELQIVAAVVAYQTDNAKFPSLDPDQPQTGGSTDADTIVGDASKIPGAGIQYDNSALFNTLRAISAGPNLNNRTNPRRVSYFEAKPVFNPDLPKSGFLEKLGTSSDLASKKGCLFDPWGTEFFVVMDTNYDNQLNVSAVYTDFSYPDAAPRGSAGAFSLGLDRRVGSEGLPPNVFQAGAKVSDDVISWH